MVVQSITPLSMEESSSQAAAAASSLLPLPPRLPRDDDEPWWVLPSSGKNSDEGTAGFTVLGGAPASASATPLAAMLRRITSTSTSSSGVQPLPHADAALAMRLFEHELEGSVAACKNLLEKQGAEALAKVAKASPLVAAAAAVAAATATAAAATGSDQLPPDLSLFEASPLASAWLEAFLQAPVTIQWAEAASRLASKGGGAAEAAAAAAFASSSSSSSSRRSSCALTETNLLPPPSFARAAVSHALQAAQPQQQHPSPLSGPAAATALGEPSAPSTTTTTSTPTQNEAENFVAIRLAVALVRSLLRSSPRERQRLGEPASRMELEAFCLACARSKDATELYRDLRSGAAFR